MKTLIRKTLLVLTILGQLFISAQAANPVLSNQDSQQSITKLSKKRLKAIMKTQTEEELLGYITKSFKKDRKRVNRILKKKSDKKLDKIWDKLIKRSPELEEVALGTSSREKLNHLVSDELLENVLNSVRADIKAVGFEQFKSELRNGKESAAFSCNSSTRQPASIGIALLLYGICILFLPLCITGNLFSH